MSDSILLSVDLDSIGAVIFVVIALISWISNLVGAATKKAQQPQRPAAGGPRHRDDRVRNEVETFLQEVTGKKADRHRPGDDDVFDVLEIVDEPRPAPRRKRPSAPRPKPVPRQQSGQRSQPTTPLRDRHQQSGSTMPPLSTATTAEPSRLGSGLQQHVKEYMAADRVDKHVDQHLDHDVNASVRQHIGQHVEQHIGSHRTAEQPYADVKQFVASAEVAALLRNPAGIRQAILISEILARPKSLRRD